LILYGFKGIDLDMCKLVLSKCADDIVIMSETEERLRHYYCSSLLVNLYLVVYFNSRACWKTIVTQYFLENNFLLNFNAI